MSNTRRGGRVIQADALQNLSNQTMTMDQLALQMQQVMGMLQQQQQQITQLMQLNTGPVRAPVGQHYAAASAPAPAPAPAPEEDSQQLSNLHYVMLERELQEQTRRALDAEPKVQLIIAGPWATAYGGLKFVFPANTVMTVPVTVANIYQQWQKRVIGLQNYQGVLQRAANLGGGLIPYQMLDALIGADGDRRGAANAQLAASQ